MGQETKHKTKCKTKQVRSWGFVGRKRVSGTSVIVSESDWNLQHMLKLSKNKEKEERKGEKNLQTE